jgi:hypothetical protein
MQVYAIAVSAGSRGNVGKLCPQDMANPIKGPALKTVFSGFQALAVRRSVRSYLRMPNQPIETINPNTGTFMKTSSRQRLRRFQLKLLGYGNCYYIERIGELEKELKKTPRNFQIDLIGVGEIPADSALLIRSVLMARSPKTRVITNARSSLQNGSVLVWLAGDTRIIREDAKVFFRRATICEDEAPKEEEVWKDDEPSIWDLSSEIDPEEGDYVRVLQLINEFLPVKEMAGRLIAVPELRQFGLVDNEKVDHFLAQAFAQEKEPHDTLPLEQDNKKQQCKTVSRLPPGKKQRRTDTV